MYIGYWVFIDSFIKCLCLFYLFLNKYFGYGFICYCLFILDSRVYWVCFFMVMDKILEYYGNMIFILFICK